MEITSLKLETCSSRKMLSRLKNSGFESSKTDAMTIKKRGLHRYDLEASTSNDNKQLQDLNPWGSNRFIERSLVNCSRGKIRSHCFKGKRVLQAGEVEQLNEWFKILEEETEIMKQSLLKGVKERKELMNEIYQQFQIIEQDLRDRNQETREASYDTSLIVNPLTDGRLGTGLSQVLSQDSNPSLVIRDLSANTLAIIDSAQVMHEYFNSKMNPSSKLS